MKIVSIKRLPYLFIILSFQLLDSSSTGADLNYKNYLTNLIQNTINNEDQSRLASMIEPLRAKYALNNFDDCYEPSYRNQTMHLFDGMFNLEKIIENYYIEEQERVQKLPSTSLQQKVKTLLENVEFIIKEVDKCLSSPADKRTIVGFTSLCDWTDAEFRRLLGCELLDNSFQNDTIQPEEILSDTENVEIPDAFDWRDKGYVGRIKDQNPCESCYIFASASNVETAYMIQKQVKYDQCHVDVSEQAVLDCIPGKDACGHGGSAPTVWDLLKSRGIFDGKDYPYTGIVKTCKTAPPNRWGIKIRDYFYSERLIEEKRLQRYVLKHGAMYVAIKAPLQLKVLRGSDNWDGDSDPSVKVNHAVTVVGWDRTHWIIKNSWGENWGDKGYYIMKRGGNRRGILQVRGYANLEQ